MSDDGRFCICSIQVEKEDERDKARYVPDYIDKKVLFPGDLHLSVCVSRLMLLPCGQIY
jgi:hypothetical protein